jgi:hypothetical protein
MRSLRAAGVANGSITTNIDACMKGATPGTKTPRVGSMGPKFLPAGVIGGAALTILTSPSVAHAATIDQVRQNQAAAFLSENVKTDQDGDGLPPVIDPDDSVPTTCPPELLDYIYVVLGNALNAFAIDTVTYTQRQYSYMVIPRDVRVTDTVVNLALAADLLDEAARMIAECESSFNCCGPCCD